MRKPNTKCCICKKDLYRQPSTLSICKNSYCLGCQSQARRKKTYVFKCETCQIEKEVAVWGNNGKQRKFCSHTCANKSRRGLKYTGNRNRSRVQERITLLRNTFGFTTCMVRNCNYSRVYDVHRFIEGKNGGKYEVGNMYAICPNHHRELHAHLITFEQVNDHELIAVEKLRN